MYVYDYTDLVLVVLYVTLYTREQMASLSQPQSMMEGNCVASSPGTKLWPTCPPWTAPTSTLSSWLLDLRLLVVCPHIKHNLPHEILWGKILTIYNIYHASNYHKILKVCLWSHIDSFTVDGKIEFCLDNWPWLLTSWQNTTFFIIFKIHITQTIIGNMLPFLQWCSYMMIELLLAAKCPWHKRQSLLQQLQTFPWSRLMVFLDNL